MTLVFQNVYIHVLICHFRPISSSFELIWSIQKDGKRSIEAENKCNYHVRFSSSVSSLGLKNGLHLVDSWQARYAMVK